MDWTQPRTKGHPGHRSLLRWWDRIGIGVRCAYNPACSCAPLLYLQAGRRVAAAGARSEEQVQRRLLTVLLQTARDEALPWEWRNQCLECTTWPLARLLSLLRYSDPLALEVMHGAVQAAHDRLGLPPRVGRRP